MSLIKEFLKRNFKGFICECRDIIPLILIVAGVVFLIAHPNIILTGSFRGEGLKHRQLYEWSRDDDIMANGYSWDKINRLNLSESQKDYLKNLILKITLEASNFSGKPVISLSGSFDDYRSAINGFYNNPANKEIPIFFSLKIADMVIKNAPQSFITDYRNSIKRQLRDVNVIKDKLP